MNLYLLVVDQSLKFEGDWIRRFEDINENLRWYETTVAARWTALASRRAVYKGSVNSRFLKTL